MNLINYVNNSICFENINLVDIVRNNKTPFYLYSWNGIEKNINNVNEALESLDYELSFALKANNNMYILDNMRSLGLGVDIVSEGEFEIIKSLGFNNNKIVVNGNAKSKKFLVDLINYEAEIINIDSVQELIRLENIVNEMNRKVNIGLRINPDIDAKTHPSISTGMKNNKFGIDIKIAKKIIEKYYNHKYIKIIGIHVHIGSQILDIAPYVECYQKIYDFYQNLECHELKIFDIGGGWGIDYLKNNKNFPLNEFKIKVVPILRKFNLKIIIELGRYLIGNAGILVGNVEYIKRNLNKNFIVTQLSMANLIRPNLYNSYHHIYTQRNDNDIKIKADIVGPICESGDFIAKDRLLNLPKENEIIVVGDVGAYGYSMCSNYNMSLKIKELMLDGELLREIRPCEEIEQLICYYKK